TILDVNADRLRYLDDVFRGRVRTVISNEYTIAQSVAKADLLIGAVLQTGKRAPKLVTEEMVRSMQPGSVIVDVAIDQGGCVETIDRVTTHSDPVYVKHGVIHYAVANIPGIVPRTSTLALTNATLPYIIKLADLGLDAVKADAAFAKGVNTYQGYLTHEGVATSLNMEYVPLAKLM
ncbi:MAG: alanine dehydrogenase, partial [Desulfofundulus sp.]